MGKEAKLIEQARGHLEQDEQVIAGVLGTYEVEIKGSDNVRSGVLCATDRRVVFYAKKLTGYDLESYPYASISSINQGKNMMGNKVTFYASGNKVNVKWIQDVEKLSVFMNVARANVHAKTTQPLAPTMPPAAAPAAQVDIIEQIKQLGELRDAGIVTDSEFEGKKAELLARL
ncbi:MAG: hypothetical protein ACJAR2_000995 [Ilumatobacter sp.]|jgi:hypothetical protein